MKNIFSLKNRHAITEANINYYASEFIHPKRKMKEHDFIYMLQGVWKFGQNDEVFELKKDCVLILPASHTHYGISACTPHTKTMYFHASLEDGDLTNSKNGDCICLESLIDVSLNKNIKNLFNDIVNASLASNHRKASICFDLLLCELSEMGYANADATIADKIKRIIHSNPEKFFTNTDLAKMTNVSVKTAENKFKAMFGTTIHQYILNFKITESVSYFERFPDITIKQISHNLGFYDEYHFSKQFKQIKGVSPTEYKKNMAQKKES